MSTRNILDRQNSNISANVLSHGPNSIIQKRRKI